ncbi:hypothetical protein OCGS_1558 [Oceaniovalibus guishaninsula JLT2003]|uniref:AsmA-like C-terminal domain-containing protein n=1 Tax=Oceaniovalibus guishaninsula JLT2003 TaxID=1231392 RepID=K2HN81_9RHOB|nr:AsmA-like C-terminal region-containing protein [Oceaniovalibus guishaninsula]EKE44314.1 hypothetical protein OCGS_1558 [Oceaniovalibus guishaninsula JLT2003]
MGQEPHRLAATGPRPARRRKEPRRGRRHLRALAALVLLAAILAATLATLALTERRLVLPAAATARIEARLNRNLDGFSVALGDVAVALTRQGVPRLWLEDVTVTEQGGVRLAELGRVGFAFDPRALLDGRAAPRILRVTGAQMTLRRDSEGAFDLGAGGAPGDFAGPGVLLDGLDALLARAPFDRLHRIELTDAIVTLEDARSARIWQVTRGSIGLQRLADGAELSLLAEVFNGTDDLAQVRISLRTWFADGRASLSASVARAPAADIAMQSPVLSFLRVLDAPISASLRTDLDAGGQLASVAGTLEIGAGALRPRQDAPPVPFEGAKAYFSYDPKIGRLDFPQVSVRSTLARVALDGHADLADVGPGGWPRALAAKFRIADLAVDAGDLLAGPVAFGGGDIDLRVRLSPFEVDLTRLVLIDDAGIDAANPLTATGRVAALPGGWDVAVDLAADRLDARRLLDLWPVPVGRGTRRWVDANIAQGTLHDVTAALRKPPEAPKPSFSTDFAFDGARITPLGDLPPITGAGGTGSLTADRFTLTMEEGIVAPPGRGAVSLAGSTMLVADTRQKPALGQFVIRSKGPLRSHLAVIDAAPLSLLHRAGRDPDLATGRVAATTNLSFPFRRGLGVADLTLDVAGEATDLASTAIVPGRTLTADALQIAATTQALTVGGRAQLDGVAFDGRWRQALAGPDRGAGRVTGQVALSPQTLRRFGVTLPDGLAAGSGTGTLTLDLTPGAPPAFRLTSDLAGIALSLDAVTWSKPAATPGDFAIAGALGDARRIDALSLSAPGLDAAGDLTLAPGGGLEALRLSRVRLGGWFDGAVRIASRGAGRPPAIAVTGGSVDLRRADLGGGGGGERGPVRLTLDRLTVTDGIALTDARVDLDVGRMLAGRFDGRVNGGAAIAGRIAGTAAGAAIRVQSDDAGAVLRDAGLFEKVAGGRLDLALQPAGAPGTYDGQVIVTGPRLRDAPAAIELLSAISVVGLVEQAQQGGIPFDRVEAGFRLAPDRVTLYRSSAVGASLGVSMDGTFFPASKRLDMQGVVSPFYLVNSVGSFLTRRGEGLIGMNFTLGGTAADPQVGVNPLSLLTPGMFRDIFRRPPPQR